MSAEPFTIAVSDEELAHLRTRLLRTRWPDHLDDVGWSQGTDPVYLRSLVEYWVDAYDWREQERWLNSFAHFRADVDGAMVHFIHERGSGPNRVPLLLLHGWPGSFVQMLDLTRLMLDPGIHDTDAALSFDIVVGSLPGFGFSDPPRRHGMNEAGMAEVFHRLMTETLGYARYAVRGSDFGAGVLSQMGALYPDAVIGLHSGGTSPHPAAEPADATPAERRYLAQVHTWRRSEVGYAQLQSTKPQSLATALNDSPAGLAGWIVEKFQRWSDCDGDVERRFTKDQLLTNIMVYWISQSISSSIRLYAEDLPDREPDVPFAHLMSSRDMFFTPREWSARTTRIDRWTEIDRGGHFLEWEEPTLVAQDIRAFLGSLLPGESQPDRP